ncbi:MAG: peptidylprolyl isomerase [Candidatus Limnocylindrales bacterium]
MTFRTRTAPKPTRRRVRRSDSRRNVYLTLSFTLAIASALALMGGVFLASYYVDHGAAIAGVNGEAISKDAVRDRVGLNDAIYQRQIANYTTMRNQGKLATDEYNTIVGNIQTTETSSTIYSDALTQLINETQLRQYAVQNNIVVTDQQIAAQIQTDATIAEMRHVKVIAVAVKATPPSSTPTQADIDSAQAKAQGYLKEIQGGKAWDDVAKEASSDSANTGGSVGDLGLTTRDDIGVEPDLANATFALKNVNDITPIIKGSDGVWRFATVTKIVPAFTDADWQTSIASASSGDLYRAMAREEATKKAVREAIEAKYISGPTVQRHVLEIAVPAGYGQPGDGDEVKIRILVFSPSHDQVNAASVASTDPAWADAKSRADAALAKLKQDPSQFATMAADTTVNDDKYWNTDGGEIPWIPSDLFNATTSTQQGGLGLNNVQAAVFKDGLTPGTILDPIQETSQGYIVVQFQGRRPAPDLRIAIDQFNLNSGADFADLAKSSSEAVDAPTGGDLGWVSPYQLTSVQEQAIDSTPVGQVSNMVSSSGYFVYKVVEEQTRTSDADQQAKLKNVVFQRWLTEFQGNALVWQDATALAALNPSATP